MSNTATSSGVPIVSLRVIALIFATVIPFFSVIPSSTQAAVTTSITQTSGAGDLNTTITQNGNVYTITDGTRAGTNLFHSFGNFSVGAGDIANFLNNTGLLTSNILGRVTGGNVSNIFGTIQTMDFGNANLFLINPSGFLFGPSATLNVGGTVTFTTADYMRLPNGTNNGYFYADPAGPSLLTAAPVAAFGFLGSNAASIAIQGGTLEVPDGKALSFIGGPRTFTTDMGVIVPPGVTMTGGSLSAPNGLIYMATVTSPGEVPMPSLSGPPLGSLGSSSLSDNAVIRIRSGEFVMDHAFLTAGNSGEASPNTISVDVQGAMIMRNGSAILSQTSGAGAGRDISISSQSMDLLDGSQIVSSNSGTGSGGSITITATNSINIAGIDPNNRPDGVVTNLGLVASGIYTTTSGGKGGAVTITTPLLVVSDVGHIATLASGNGDGGDITIHAPVLNLENGGRIFSASGIDFKSFSTGGTGAGGNIIISDSESITLSGQDAVGNPSRIRTETRGGGIGGTIQINSPHASISLTDRAAIETASLGEAAAGNILIDSSTLNISGGAGIGTSGSGLASSGNLNITAHSGIFLSGNFNSDTPSRIVNENQDFGGTGATTISTGTLSLDNGARILSDTFFDLVGPAIPKISITANSVTLSNSSRIDVRNILSNVGALSISAPTISLSNQSTTSTLTSADGNAGPINLWTNNLSLSGGSQLISSTSGAGGGGNINVVAGQSVSLTNGSTISDISTGAGNAGNIQINAGQQLEMRDSSIKTEAAQASGGNIDIQAIDRVRLVNSTISTSVLGGSGSGGNITIDPNVVVLQNSQIIAQAIQGAGGNITITTPLFLADQTSLVSASSQFGLNGTVTIQSPTSNLSGSVGSLPSSMRQQQALQAQRCAALYGGESSSFVIAGRDTIPTEPGGWLASPLGLHSLGRGLLAETTIDEQRPTTLVMAQTSEAISLRRLTPAGFLTQRFAGNGSDGCRS